MGRFTFPKFIVDQWTGFPPLETVDLAGQTILAVGANIGLGLEAAKHIARMKPGKLVLACRSLKKGEDAAKGVCPFRHFAAYRLEAWLCAEIREATGFENTACYAVDLAVFASVVAFAEEFELVEGRVDIVLHSAGVAHPEYERTTDGWETKCICFLYAVSIC
jgi:retinol dehydrogenase-12